MLQNDHRGTEISNLQRELFMKNVELKVYANKLKIMREENTTVRMQLLDPAMIRRIGGVRHSLDQQSGSSKENIIIDFNRVELTHDVVLLQEEMKQLHVENVLLKDRIAKYHSDASEKEKAQTKYINKLQEELAIKKQRDLAGIEPELNLEKMVERLQY